MTPTERITAAHEDSWECACGNVPETDGFWPCLADGTEVEPTVEGPWDGKLVLCYRCGRIMDQSTWDGSTVAVVGRKPEEVLA